MKNKADGMFGRLNERWEALRDAVTVKHPETPARPQDWPFSGTSSEIRMAINDLETVVAEYWRLVK